MTQPEPRPLPRLSSLPHYTRELWIPIENSLRAQTEALFYTPEFSLRQESRLLLRGGAALMGHPETGSSAARAMANVICCMVGAGILGLGHTLALLSWAALPVIAAMGMAQHFSGQRLGACLLEDAELLTYRDVGGKAFGRAGQRVVLVLQLVNCVGTALLYLILVGDNL
eukprot:RCo050996